VEEKEEDNSHTSKFFQDYVLQSTSHILKHLRYVLPDVLRLFAIVVGEKDIAVCITSPLGRDEGQGGVWWDSHYGGVEIHVWWHRAGGVGINEGRHDLCGVIFPNLERFAVELGTILWRLVVG